MDLRRNDCHVVGRESNASISSYLATLRVSLVSRQVSRIILFLSRCSFMRLWAPVIPDADHLGQQRSWIFPRLFRDWRQNTSDRSRRGI
jgi:hypothetical protein